MLECLRSIFFAHFLKAGHFAPLNWKNYNHLILKTTLNS